MTIAKASRRAGVLALLALACGRPSTAPDSERAVAHCERDLPNARVCTSSGSRDDADPLLDSDEDGVIDSADCCPELPEDLDGFEDQDGCPDCDNDGDGIPDADRWVLLDRAPGWSNLDRDGEIDCRYDPEDFDGDRDHDGCPEE